MGSQEGATGGGGQDHKDHVNWHKSLLKSLEDAGFPKERAERALIATAHKDFQTAARWLKYHRNDPSATADPCRQYILFLTPKGQLNDKLNEFWSASLKQCGRNAVHECFPHITLTRFFKVEDFRVPPLLDILENVTRKQFQKRMHRIRLFSHKSKGYMALFMEESSSSWLNELVKTFADKVHASLGVTAPIHSGQFHLTLAYQFDEEKQKILDSLVKEISLDLPSDWELQLYSRNKKTASAKQFRHVIHAYAAESKDELSMIHGQHVILDMEQDGYKGWLKGTLHETGKSGLFPANYTERASEWKFWTLHWMTLLPKPVQEDKVDSRSYPVHEHVQIKSISSDQVEKKNEKKSEKKDETKSERTSEKPSQSSSTPTSPRQNQNFLRSSGSVSIHRSQESQSNVARVNSLPRSYKKSRAQQQSPLTHARKPRRIFVMRHGERVDVTFGHSWFFQFFDDNGNYHRRNLNMPKRLPTRNGGPETFAQDSPITEIGACQARLTGESLFAHGIKFTKVFSSPAFRCVQTAESVMEALKIKEKVKIKIDPGLYEWLAWCRGKLPQWLSRDELLAFGINIDSKYEQFMDTSNFHLNETMEQFYYRTYNVMKWIIEHLDADDENILIVGHSASLDACTRHLCGGPQRTQENFIKLVQKVPYCGVSVIEEAFPNKWRLIQPPIPSLVHNGNGKMDWRMLSQSEIKHPQAV